ncbi:MAG: hypothetical protein ABL879_01550 [Devosia sp.]
MSVQWSVPVAGASIVEFHNIRADRGCRDALIALPSLAPALGRFRVADAPDQMVEVRGFAGMAERRQALTAAAKGPDWRNVRTQRADLVADESVHLMRSIAPQGFRLPPAPRAYVALISELRFQEQIGNYHLWLRLFLRKAGMDPLASFATLEAENDVPAVPVRRHRSEHIALLRYSGGLVPELPLDLLAMLRFPPDMLVLEPAVAPGG